MIEDHLSSLVNDTQFMSSINNTTGDSSDIKQQNTGKEIVT